MLVDFIRFNTATFQLVETITITTRYGAFLKIVLNFYNLSSLITGRWPQLEYYTGKLQSKLLHNLYHKIDTYASRNMVE